MHSKTWNHEKIEALYQLPFMELLFQAQSIHREHFPANEIELCTLLSIKTGRCPEDCAYCPQSAHYDTNIEPEKLFTIEEVTQRAREAKAKGSIRFCMGAAWRSPPKKDFPRVIEMIKAVKEVGLETCVTLGMLDQEQAVQLQEAGLDYYNHNLDTSPDYYKKIISTRTYQDRLETLNHIQQAGINMCCGGIIGMGETRKDRIELLSQLATLPQPLKSIPINRLIPITGTPLAAEGHIDNFEFIRMVAVTRIVMPISMIRLSAGREGMSEEMQTLCFLAGANSIFYGEKLFTAKNPAANTDTLLLQKLGMTPKQAAQTSCNV